MKIRPLIPLKLLISAAVLFGLSFAAGPALNALVPDLQKSSNVLVIAIPFLLIFIPIILTFMSLIVFVSKVLHERVPEKVYKSIEYVFIAGIFLGIISMFQPWVFRLFKIGFFVLFVSLLGFMLWSHLAMKRKQQESSAEREAQR
jgi:predicted neutral ceramidase superfamily lipid hydrolase